MFCGFQHTKVTFNQTFFITDRSEDNDRQSLNVVVGSNLTVNFPELTKCLVTRSKNLYGYLDAPDGLIFLLIGIQRDKLALALIEQTF